MHGATVEELRELSRRSRKTQGVGFLALLAGLAGVLLAAMTWSVLDYAAVILGGAAFVAYAHAAGQERGAFRRVFRRISIDAKAARTLVVQENSKETMPAKPAHSVKDA